MKFDLDFTGVEGPEEPRVPTYADAGTIAAIRLAQLGNMPDQRPVWRSDGVAEDSMEGNTDHLYRRLPRCTCGLHHRGDCY